MSNGKGEGPANKDEAKARVKAFMDKPEHKQNGADDPRNKNTKNDDLADTGFGGSPNPDFE